MLISFIGSPASGKTTIAAKLFTYLKEHSYNSELITEQARLYIAKLKYIHQTQDVVLTDLDQRAILNRQGVVEQDMKYACNGKSIIVSDSSVVNSLLYMTDGGRATVQEEVKKYLPNYDLVFYCAPISDYQNKDPNRLHSALDILKLDLKIATITEEIVKYYDKQFYPIPLIGNPVNRLNQILKVLDNSNAFAN